MFNAIEKEWEMASANSAHRIGTTFSIAYSRFVTTDDRYLIPKEQLKHILAEVLLSLKKIMLVMSNMKLSRVVFT